VRGSATVAEVAAVASLAHFKDRVESVKKGSECGIALEGFAGCWRWR
jgi:translation initiation factor IF-2